jgi:glycerol-3-phosphate acyltransferase PlsY
MEFLFIGLIGYLIGSVPFAYVIGKVFYGTDVRQHGSGNLGGSNTGRVLGAKAGVAVMTMDLLKVTLSYFLATLISSHPWAACWGALCAALGHCYPIFVRFRGGKAVAAFYGFLFALWVFGGLSATVFFVPLAVFLTVLAVTKIVSLSSTISACTAAVYLWLMGAGTAVVSTAAICAGLIVLRHSGNIRRMIGGTERKISWMG